MSSAAAAAELRLVVVDNLIDCCDASATSASGPATVIIDAASGHIVRVAAGDVSHEPEYAGVAVSRFPAGATLMPGFIDCHVHLSIAKDDYQMDHLRLSSADKALRCLAAAQGLLRAGFTTVRSAGEADVFYPAFAVKRAIAAGSFRGPTIVGAGHYISVTGSGGDINTLSRENASCCVPDGLVVDGADAFTRAVREEIKYGADWIKLMVTGAFMAATSLPQDSPERTHMAPGELAAAVEEATRRGVPVMAHAHGAAGIADAARAGVRSIEHASFIDADGIAACLERGTFLVPTFTIGDYFRRTGSASGAQDRMLQLMDATDARHCECLTAAAAAGVKIALGTDYVGWPASEGAREFRFLVECVKLSPMAAIRAGTASAAELLQMPDRGVVRAGALADLVVIGGNPVERIELLETAVLAVFKAGVLV